MNIKKLFASVTSVLMLATSLPVATFGATYSDELQEAYDYAYENGITTMSSIDNANMYGSLTRIALAKMIANYAMDVLGLEPDTDKECSFPDVSDSLDAQYDNGVTNACQLGLMGVGITNFNPYGIVTRAEFGTVLSRALRGDEYDGATPYYKDHLDALKDAGIMTNISNPSMTEVRGYVMLMMMRAEEDATPAACLDPMVQIACALNPEDDACPAECRDLEDEEEEEEVKDGNLSVELSDDTLASQKLPQGAEGVPAATFKFKADSDITLKALTLKRVGMDAKNAVQDVAIFIDGQRASNARSFNSSSDDVTVYLNPSYTVKAGKTVNVVAKVTTLTIQGAEFAISLTDVESTAEDTEADFPITANEMELGSVTATSVTLAKDGSVANVKVGNDVVDLLKFSLKNNSTSNETIEFSSITFKEDGSVDESSELENFRLYNNGNEIAMVKNTNGKYVTFELDDPMTIGDGKTEKFVVKADIVGGAGKIVNFILDKDLDITAESSKYGYVSITNYLGTSNDVNIEAGALTITTVDPEADEIRKDKDDIVFGELKVFANAGKELELQKFKVTIDETTSTGNFDVNTLLENIELYDATRKSVYDLSCTTDLTGSKLVCSDTNLNISLRDAKDTVFQIRADTKNVSINGYKFSTSISNIGVASQPDFYVVELGDDKQVTDITPSSITFKTVEGKASAGTVNQLTLSTSKNAVIGSTDVEGIKFNVEAGNSSALSVKEIKAKIIYTLSGTTTTGNATNAWLTQLKLYKGDTLIKTKSASQLAAGVVTFDGLDVNIDKNEKQEFTVKADIINDINKANDTLVFSITDIDAEDEDNDDIAVQYSSADLNSTNPVTSVRTITIKGYGTLANVVYTSEAPVNAAQNVLGNTTSDFVAAFEVTATNEGIKIKDLQINQNTTGKNLKDAVNEIILYKADKTTEIARKSVSSDTVTFNSLNYVVEEGSEKIYVKVVAHKIGKDQAGTTTAGLTLGFKVTNAVGNDSTKTIATSNLPSEATPSREFNVVPVNVNAPIVAESQGAKALGDNAETLVAKVKLVADTTTNTRTDNGATAKARVETFRLKVTTKSNLTLTSGSTSHFRLERVNPLNGSLNSLVGTYNGGDDYVTFDMSNSAAFSNNNEVVGEVTYEVFATVPVTTGTQDAFLELSAVPSATTPSVVFGTDQTVTLGIASILNSTVRFGQLKYSK